jgi:hypothetical protein
MFLLCIFPSELHTLDFVVLNYLTHSRKILLVVLHIGKAKDLSVPLRIFLFSTESRQVLGPFSPSSQSYRWLFLWRQSGRGVKLIGHIYLVQVLKMSGYLYI